VTGSEVATTEQAVTAEVVAPPPTPKRSTTSKLGSMEKAAALLVSLGPEQAGEILKHLGDEEIQAVSTEMARLRQVRPETALELLGEFSELIVAAEHVSVGGLDFARAALERSVGAKRAEVLLEQLAFAGNRPFEFLRRTPPEQIVSFLTDESPQTVALVTASLPSTIAARVLSALPERMQSDVALRIATMTDTSPEIIRELEAGLKHKLSNVLGSELTAAGGVESLADILNHAGRSTERAVLEGISETHNELAEEIRARLFTFDDIVILTDRDMQVVLRDVDQKDLVLALRGVSAEVRDKILRNMSQRGAEMLVDDMETMQSQPKALVEEAQSRVVGSVRRLDESGAITLARSDEDEVI
jgi:flagellar motor switch protein FliG